MQRIDIGHTEDDRGRKLPEAVRIRIVRRGRAAVRMSLRRLHQLRGALAFAALLAGVGVALLLPLLLDDLAFLPSYLLRPSPDAIVITEPILVSDQPRMTVMSGTLSVPPALSGQARTVEALAALIKGGSARVALKQPVIHLELSPLAADESGPEPDWSQPALRIPLNAASPLVTALEDASFETLSVRDGTILLKSDGRTDILEEVSADITVKRKTAIRLKGAFRYLGELLTVDATLGARIGRGQSPRMPLRAQVQSGLFNVTVDGRLELGPGVQLVAPSADVGIANIRSVARWLGHVWPSGLGLKNFAAHGNATWAGQTIAFQKGSFEIDGNKGNGALSLTLGGARPSIAGTLAFADVDVSTYLPVAGDSAGGAGDPAGPPGKSLIAQFKAARDLSLPLIGSLNADLRISAETVSAGPFIAGRTAASLALRDGHLLFNLADMELPNGGSADGEVEILGLTATPSYAMLGRLQGVELGDVTAVIAAVPMLRGRGTVQFDVKAGGRSGMDVLSRLNGTLLVEMPRGGFATCSIKELSANAERDTLDACRTMTSLAGFKSAASATNGVIGFQAIDIASGSNRMRLDGTVDLVTSVMHLNVSATAPASAVSVAGELPPEAPPAQDMIAIRGRPDEARIIVRGK